MKDPKTGKPTDSGFVGFTNIESATKAKDALNGTQAPNGKNLFVGYARPLRKPRKNRSSFGSNEYGSKQNVAVQNVQNVQ